MPKVESELKSFCKIRSLSMPLRISDIVVFPRVLLRCASLKTQETTFCASTVASSFVKLADQFEQFMQLFSEFSPKSSRIECLKHLLVVEYSVITSSFFSSRFLKASLVLSSNSSLSS